MIEDLRPAVAGRPWQALTTLSLDDTLGTVRRRWPTIAIASLVGAASLYGASTIIPTRYVATAEIFVDPRTIQPLSSPPEQADSNGELLFVESQAHIIGSTSVLQRVVDSAKLNDDPEFAGLSSDRNALTALEDRVVVRRPERTFILDVSVQAGTADKAAALANAVAQAYFDEQAAAHTRMAQRANQALTDRLEGLRNRLREAEEKADGFRRDHGLVGTRTQLVSEQQLTDANTQLALTRSRVIVARARLDEIQRLSRGADPGAEAPEAVASPTITLLRGQQADAKRRLDRQIAELGPLHPAVRDAQSEVDAANRAVASELARIADSAKVDLRRATAAEAAQRKIVDDLSDQSSNASSAITQLGAFDREVEVNKNLLNTFLSRARETSELERLDTGDARLISSARPPRNRSFPPRGALFAAFGSLLGLGAGFLLAVRRDGRAAAAPARSLANTVAPPAPQIRPRRVAGQRG